MPKFAVEWEADYPPEFGGGRGQVVSAEKCRDAERERDEAHAALRKIADTVPTYLITGEDSRRVYERALAVHHDMADTARSALGLTQNSTPGGDHV